MRLQDAFNIRKQVVVVSDAEKGSAEAAGAAKTAPPPSSQGVFLSAQSVLSFPIAAGLVTMLWKLVQHFQPNAHDIVVLYISIVIGLLIFGISVSDESARPKGGLNWIVSILIALLNSLVLASSALGLANGVLGH